MIIIEGNEDNSIKYSCDCGIKGECIIKPQPNNTTIIVDVVCPHCGDSERVKLIQYNSEEIKKDLLKDDVDLTWSAILENRLRS